MKRRILLELETKDDVPGVLLGILCQLSEALEKIQMDGLLEDFGFGLEDDVTWFVRTAAQMTKDLEETEK